LNKKFIIYHYTKINKNYEKSRFLFRPQNLPYNRSGGYYRCSSAFYYCSVGVALLYVSGHPDLFHQKKKGGLFMDSVLITILGIALILVFAFFIGIGKIADEKIRINRHLCDEKIRYTKEKTKIWLDAEKEKKDLGIFTSPPK
jgi:hypothetical protein